jgi:hypothetical protein
MLLAKKFANLIGSGHATDACANNNDMGHDFVS